MTSPRNETLHPEHAPENICSAEQDVVGNLSRAYDCLWSEMAKFFQSFDITAQQYNVLKVLASCDEGSGIACQAIGEHLLNRVPDITRLLDRLEQAGLIRRERCAADRRVVRTHLSAAGRAKVEEVRAPLQQALKQRFAHMTADDLGLLNRLLLKLREPHCPNARSAFMRALEDIPRDAE